MNTKYNNSLNLSKLSNSIEIISSLDSCLKTTDLSSYIIDVEKLIKNSNFEHNNYIVNYKNELNDIIKNIEEIKREVNKLNEALHKTNESYQKIFYDDEDIKELSNIYPNTDFSNLKNSLTNFRENLITDSKEIINTGTITEIPPVSENKEIIVEKKSRNLAPIGLGVLATGASSVVSAMIIDKKEKKEQSNNNYIPKVVNNNIPIVENAKEENIKEEVIENDINTPYQASRTLGEKDIFYNDSSDEYFTGQ